jgi:hypothetical protein
MPKRFIEETAGDEAAELGSTAIGTQLIDGAMTNVEMDVHAEVELKLHEVGFPPSGLKLMTGLTAAIQRLHHAATGTRVLPERVRAVKSKAQADGASAPSTPSTAMKRKRTFQCVSPDHTASFLFASAPGECLGVLENAELSMCRCASEHPGSDVPKLKWSRYARPICAAVKRLLSLTRATRTRPAR